VSNCRGKYAKILQYQISLQELTRSIIIFDTMVNTVTVTLFDEMINSGRVALYVTIGAALTTVLPVLFKYCYKYCYSDSRKL
jgi:hypothetical protein